MAGRTWTFSDFELYDTASSTATARQRNFSSFGSLNRRMDWIRLNCERFLGRKRHVQSCASCQDQRKHRQAWKQNVLTYRKIMRMNCTALFSSCAFWIIHQHCALFFFQTIVSGGGFESDRRAHSERPKKDVRGTGVYAPRWISEWEEEREWSTEKKSEGLLSYVELIARPLWVWDLHWVLRASETKLPGRQWPWRSFAKGMWFDWSRPLCRYHFDLVSWASPISSPSMNLFVKCLPFRWKISRCLSSQMSQLSNLWHRWNMWRQKSRSCRWLNIPSSWICLVHSRHGTDDTSGCMYSVSDHLLSSAMAFTTHSIAIVPFLFFLVGWKAALHAPWIHKWRRIVLVSLLSILLNALILLRLAFMKPILVNVFSLCFVLAKQSWNYEPVIKQVLEKRGSPSQWTCSLLHLGSLAVK